MNDHYVVELQRWGRRWAWAVSQPEPDPNRPINCASYGGTHPFRDKGVRLLFDVPHERKAHGWAFTENGAKNRAARVIRRHMKADARLNASQLTYRVETP